MYFSYFTFSLFLAIFQVLKHFVSICMFFQCFSPYFMSYHVSFSYSSFVFFLAKFQVLQCLCHIFQVFFSFLTTIQVLQCVCLNLYVFQVSLHIPGPTMIFSFSMFVSFLDIFKVLQHVFLIFHVFQISRHDPGPTVCVSHFPCFSVFSPKSRSYSVYFSYFTSFTVSRHIPGPTVCVSLFCKFFHIFRLIPDPTMIFSFSSFVSFLNIFKFL